LVAVARGRAGSICGVGEAAFVGDGAIVTVGEGRTVDAGGLDVGPPTTGWLSWLRG
jgi:hypothetical protein